MNEIIRIGVDTSKHVFQLHGVGKDEVVVLCQRLPRNRVERFFDQLPRGCVIGLEACGAAHHWGRLLQAQGHQVRLLPPQYVRPYVKRSKSDAADAAAICEAVGRPGMRFVAVKSEVEQARLMVLRTRELLIKQRTMLENSLRGHAAEFGVIGAKGSSHLQTILARAQESIPGEAAAMLGELYAAIGELNGRLRRLDGQLRAWHGQSPAAGCWRPSPGSAGSPPSPSS